MTHEQLINQLIDLGHVCGWLVAGFRPARTKDGWRTPVLADAAGFPDLTFYKPPRVVVIEVKIPPDKVRRDQQIWLDMLRRMPNYAVLVITPDNVEQADAALQNT